MTAKFRLIEVDPLSWHLKGVSGDGEVFIENIWRSTMDLIMISGRSLEGEQASILNEAKQTLDNLSAVFGVSYELEIIRLVRPPIADGFIEAVPE